MSLAISGKTIGKGLVGLKVVTRKGTVLPGNRAAARAIVFPISVIIPFSLIGIVVGKERRALFHPCPDFGEVGVGEGAIAMRLDFSIADIDHGDLIHVDPALTVLGIDTEDKGTIFPDTEVIVGQVGHTYASLSSSTRQRLPSSSTRANMRGAF